MNEDELKEVQDRAKDGAVLYGDIHNLLEHVLNAKTKDGEVIEGNTELEKARASTIMRLEDTLDEAYSTLGIRYIREHEDIYKDINNDNK